MLPKTIKKPSPLVSAKSFEGIVAGFSKILGQLDTLIARKEVTISKNAKAIDVARVLINDLDKTSTRAADEITRAETFQINLKNLIGAN